MKMTSMASLLNIPIPCASINKNTCRWSMVPSSTRRAGNSMHGIIEPKLQRWLGGSGRVGIGTKRGDLSRVQCEDWSCGIPPPHYPLSTKETITQFYDLINQKDPHNELPTLLEDDCQYTDLDFYIPFQGRKEVLDFLEQLMDAMGDNIKIKTESIAEGESYSASVNWHLVWKEHQIPFTAGFNHFQCEKHGEKLLIKNVTSMEEHPWKPGDYALRLLKAVSLFFDQFPAATELLLRLHSLGNDDDRSP